MEANSTHDPQRQGRPRITQLGDYKLGAKLGTGAMGAVYRAAQVSKNRPVAIKILLRRLADNDLFLQRFQREARVMARLNHPNFVRCYGIGKQYGRHYLAMELVEGGSLRDWLDRLGKFSVADALHVVLVCARALAYAHEKQLIHRDVKPDNILLTTDGQLKFADLGLATSLNDEINLSLNGRGAGTPVYVAPEQARNARDADARSDLYALGCTLYQMITGELPFRGASSLDIVMAKLQNNFRPASAHLPDLPPALDRILTRLMAAHPDDRYQCCTDLVNDVEALELASTRLSFLDNKPQAKVATKPEFTTDHGTHDFDEFGSASSEPAARSTYEEERLTAPPIRLTWWERNQSQVLGLALILFAVVAAAAIVAFAVKP